MRRNRWISVALIIFCLVIALAVIVMIRLRQSFETDRLSAGTVVDRLVVEKSARKLSVFRHGEEIRSYRAGWTAGRRKTAGG